MNETRILIITVREYGFRVSRCLGVHRTGKVSDAVKQCKKWVETGVYKYACVSERGSIIAEFGII